VGWVNADEATEQKAAAVAAAGSGGPQFTASGKLEMEALESARVAENRHAKQDDKARIAAETKALLLGGGDLSSLSSGSLGSTRAAAAGSSSSSSSAELDASAHASSSRRISGGEGSAWPTGTAAVALAGAVVAVAAAVAGRGSLQRLQRKLSGQPPPHGLAGGSRRVVGFPHSLPYGAFEDEDAVFDRRAALSAM
jgi:hypothetical protein